MKLFIQAAAFLAVSTSALSIPPSPHTPDTVAGHEPAVAGSTAARGSSVLFSVPCPGCFADADAELDFELTLDSSSLACQSSAITLNGVRLSPNPGPISFHANTPGRQEVQALWEMSCLDGEVTLLTVHINKVDKAVIQSETGFTLSLKQCDTSEVLRLERAPSINVDDLATIRQWKEPQQDPEYVVVAALDVIDDTLPTEVQEQLLRLHEIKAGIARLHYKYRKQEKHIFNMIKQDFRACDGPTCLYQTAVKNAPDFFELVKAHFKHRPDWGKLRNNRPAFWHPFDHGHKQDDFFVTAVSRPWDTKVEHTPFPLPFDAPKPESLPPLPPLPPFPEDGNGLPPPPPFIMSDHKPSERPPWAGHRHPEHHRPHFFHRHGPHRHPFFFSMGSILFFILIATFLFNCVRARTGLFRNDRRKRDRAARREEHRNRAAYRRAAMRHRWRRWWSQFRQPESTADYEEKRSRLLRQEDHLEDVMQSEIRDIRRAHEMVDDMMRAEETRQRLYHEANFGGPARPAGRVYEATRENIEGDQATEAVLPLYQPPPPSYEQELEGEMMVVDGFSYTPSASESTPESSVIDCNSVMSFETSSNATK